MMFAATLIFGMITLVTLIPAYSIYFYSNKVYNLLNTFNKSLIFPIFFTFLRVIFP